MLNIRNVKKVTYRHWNAEEPIPLILVEGLFLKELGFHCGDAVTMSYAKGQVIITNPKLINALYVPSLERTSTPQLADSHANNPRTITL